MHFAPYIYLAFIIINIMCAIIPSIEIYIWKRMLELLQDRFDMHRLLIVLIIYITLSILCKLADSTKNVIEERLIDKIQFNVDLEIIKNIVVLMRSFMIIHSI